MCVCLMLLGLASYNYIVLAIASNICAFAMCLGLDSLSSLGHATNVYASYI